MHERCLHTWRLKTANVVRSKSIERLNDGHRDNVFNQVARSLSPQQMGRSAQHWRSPDVGKHRQWTTGRRCCATVDVRRDEMELSIAATSQPV